MRTVYGILHAALRGGKTWVANDSELKSRVEGRGCVVSTDVGLGNGGLRFRVEMRGCLEDLQRYTCTNKTDIKVQQANPSKYWVHSTQRLD